MKANNLLALEALATAGIPKAVLDKLYPIDYRKAPSIRNQHDPQKLSPEVREWNEKVEAARAEKAQRNKYTTLNKAKRRKHPFYEHR